jgi:tetratricopeptide (TPR) repeat protein
VSARLHKALLGAALAVLTWTAFLGVASNGFLNYDDDVYITDNPHVLGGLSGDGVAWALSSTYAANWHPLTWMSHMLDVSMFGRNAGRHHDVSAAIHTLNVLLLFLLLSRLTGAVWRPALVAALFAVHPLHVESVAWLAERKDVLSTTFWLLTTWAWLDWVETKTSARYALVLVLFALGLMAKPMLVTLPFTLMLLDYWPLGRAGFPPLWKEKAPLLAMAAVSSVVTVVAQRSGGAMQTLAGLPFPARAANAAVAYVWYLAKTAWPSGLAVFYPHPGYLAAGPALGAALLVGAVTVVAIRGAERAPYAAVGWLWYVGTLVPVIGLVQVGAQATADRYTYVPLVGIFVAIAWGLSAVVPEKPAARYAAAALCAAWILALVPVTRANVRHFADNVTLFTNAVAVTGDNCVAQNNLGLALMGQGKTDEAVLHYKEALRIKPDYLEAHNNLAVALRALNRNDEALEQLSQALALDPNSAIAHVNFGNSLVSKGEIDAAMEHYTRALRANPNLPDAEMNLGLILDRLGRHDEAIAHLRRGTALRPDDPAAHLGLANALAAAGAMDAAIGEFDQALRLKPDYPEALNAYGIALAGRGRLDEAKALYERALAARPGYAEALNNLGLALAATNRVDDAIARFRQAVDANPEFAQAHVNLGVALAQTHHVPEAIEQFRKALAIDPNVEHGRENLLSLTGPGH